MTRLRPLYALTEGLAARTDRFRLHGLLSDADLLVVDAVARRFGESSPEVLLGLAWAVRAPRAGHIGVDLLRLAEDEREADAERERTTASGDELEPPLDWPTDVRAWAEAVWASPMVGAPEEEARPFVRQALRDGTSLLMTRRMWREQERLADALYERVQTTPALEVAPAAVQEAVDTFFEDPAGQGAQAVAQAAEGALTVVTGGPGTGKTYSVKRLLALLLGVHPTMRVELAAPTGKAAVRMAEAIAEDLDELSLDSATQARLSRLAPKTLHKLLVMRPDGSCRYSASNPLPADLVVVDEASMVDLGLMRRLVEAVSPGARLVLLGDRDQLTSVDAGTVLADCVAPALDGTELSSPLRPAIVPFHVNHRFEEAPTIAAIAEGLAGGSDDALPQVLRWMTAVEHAPDESLTDRVQVLGAPIEGRPTEEQLDRLAAPYLGEEGFVGILASALVRHGATGQGLEDDGLHRHILSALEGYRILAVHRRGPLGVAGLEREMVRRAKAVLGRALDARRRAPSDRPAILPGRHGHWLGRPVLVTRNSYEVGLMNGDIGVVLPVRGALAAVFPSQRDAGPLRSVALSRLPEHTGAFAMTVHKSQGSQFERVALVLAGRPSPIQTRELIYTGITRTSGRLDWLGSSEELEDALRRRIGRASGLGDLLWT